MDDNPAAVFLLVTLPLLEMAVPASSPGRTISADLQYKRKGSLLENRGVIKEGRK
jgi:hypothetical protein